MEQPIEEPWEVIDELDSALTTLIVAAGNADDAGQALLYAQAAEHIAKALVTRGQALAMYNRQ